jgi:acetyl esterase/lipase
VGGPEVRWSGPPSRRSRWFALLMRLTMRPLLSLGVLVWIPILRFGPPGVEMWAAWERLRGLIDRLSGLWTPAPPGTSVEPVELGDCAGEYIRAAGPTSEGAAILYLHGGGYVTGGLHTYRRFVSRLSAATDATVLNVGYRLLPRSPIAHAVADGVSGYRRLLADGHRPREIVVGGDSAGGGLTFLVAVALREAGLPPPAGLFALSPWTDLDSEPKLTLAQARTDPVIPIRQAAWIVERLISRGDPLDAALSPVNLELHDLPPTVIHVGTTEVLALDSVRIAERLAEAGVSVTITHWRGQVHVFPVFGIDVLPEAAACLAELDAFITRVTGRGQSSDLRTSTPATNSRIA